MKTWAKWTIGVSCGVAVATAIAVPVGLYLSGYWDKKQIHQIEFNVNSGLSSNARTAEKANVYSAAFNKDAQDKLAGFAKDLSAKDLQRDFSRVLTDFYEAYEDKKPGGSEVEIEEIIVKGKNDDGSFNLSVQYEIDNDRRDIGDKKPWAPVKWTPKFTVLTSADIDAIKAQISSFGNHDNNNGIDLEDLKEIFLGEKDADDLDDIGIFDQIKFLNKESDGLASVVAYELSISDIYDQLPVAKSRAGGNEVTKNTTFKIPSISLNNGDNSVALVPNEKPNVNIDPTNNHIQGITEQELSSLPAGTYVAGTDDAKISQYLSFVFGTAEQPKDIKSVEILGKDADGYVKLTISFNDANKPQEIFYLYVSQGSQSNQANPQ